VGHVPGGHPPASGADQRSCGDETALFLDACCGRLDELERLLAGACTHIEALQSENGRLKSELASCRWVEHSAAAGGGGGGGAAAARAPAAAPLHPRGHSRAAGERKTAVSASAGVIVLDSDEEEEAAGGGERHAISDESPDDGAVQRGGHGAAPENPQGHGGGETAATAATAGTDPQKSLYSDLYRKNRARLATLFRHAGTEF
jgi:hypothetical protein